MRMGLTNKNIIKYKHYKKRYGFYFLLILIFILFFAIAFFQRLNSAFANIFVPYAINVGSDSINYTVANYFADNMYSYSDFMTITFSTDNTVTSVQANSSLMNKVKADLSIYLQEQVNKLKKDSLCMPIGCIFKSPMLQGIGPDIKITVKPTDVTDLVFDESFEAVGINQVRHRIFVDVYINISIQCLTMVSSEVIEDTIPIAETVIVGEVPNYYNMNSDFPQIINNDNIDSEE